MRGVGERETWQVEEFGDSHQGAVGVLLDDGTVPRPVFFAASSSGGGQAISHWSVYDGRDFHGPRAAALRAVCSCGWSGPEHPLDWETIGDQPLREADLKAPEACERDWEAHTTEVERSTVPLPEAVTALLDQTETEIEKLTATSPLAALRAARHLEILARQVGYWAALDVRSEMAPGQAAAGLGLDESAARSLIARFCK